jgi:hypothetical protein
MDAEGYLSRPLDSGTLSSEIKRVMASKSVGRLRWTRILEQTERNLLKEVGRWNGTARYVSQIEGTDEDKSHSKQAVELQV